MNETTGKHIRVKYLQLRKRPYNRVKQGTITPTTSPLVPLCGRTVSRNKFGMGIDNLFRLRRTLQSCTYLL